MEPEIMNDSATDALGGGNGSSSALVVHNTAAVAVAEKAKATVQARYLIALHRPRNNDAVRQQVLKDCKRPGFAKVARYSKPVGGKPITGPSIRFVEAALRHMGNTDIATQVTYEDDEKRLLNVTVTDLETNVTHGLDIVITKRVERKQLKRGQQPLGTRTNSYGDTVYLVEASEDELQTKQAALVSKAVRTLGLRIIPGDLVEEAEDAVVRTLAAEDKKDPDAARKAIVDAFFVLGVDAKSLVEYVGHSIDSSSPAEMNSLRALYAAIRDGETTWADVLESREEQVGERSKGKAASLRDKAKKTADAAKGPLDFIAAAKDRDALLAVVRVEENARWIAAKENSGPAWEAIANKCKELGADIMAIEAAVNEAIGA